MLGIGEYLIFVSRVFIYFLYPIWQTSKWHWGTSCPKSRGPCVSEPRTNSGHQTQSPSSLSISFSVPLTLLNVLSYQLKKKKTPYNVKPVCGYAGLKSYCHNVTGQGPGPERVCPGPAVVGGFLTSCRKDFTTEVQVIFRVCFSKLGTVKSRKGLR